MSGYTKLFGSILDSTVWELPHATVRVWVTMLAMADRHGEIQASVPGLAHRARVTMEETKTALSAFLGPDEYSRTSTQEGRRIEPIDGGWRLVNHEKYRRLMAEEDRKAKAAERQRRYVSNRQQPSATVSGVSKRHNDAIPDTEAEAEAEAEAGSDKKPLAPLGAIVYPAAFSVFWDNIGSTRSKGLKSDALKAWEKVGKPPADALMAKWSEYLQSLGETFPKDVSRWLRARGWEEAYPDPVPSALSRGRPATSYQQTIDSMQGFLARHEGED